MGNIAVSRNSANTIKAVRYVCESFIFFSLTPAGGACELQARRLQTPARLYRFVRYPAAQNVARVFSMLLLRGHAIGRRGREMRAPILDQPFIAVAGGHVEKVDRYDGDEGSIWTVDVVHGKDRVGDRDIRFNEADPVVGEGRLRGGSDGLHLGTKVLHHYGVPLQKVTHRRHEGSIFGEQGCSLFGILLNESLGKVVSERANGCFVLSLAGTRRTGHTDDERTCEKG